MLLKLSVMKDTHLTLQPSPSGTHRRIVGRFETFWPHMTHSRELKHPNDLHPVQQEEATERTHIWMSWQHQVSRRVLSTSPIPFTYVCGAITLYALYYKDHFQPLPSGFQRVVKEVGEFSCSENRLSAHPLPQLCTSPPHSLAASFPNFP